MPPVLLGPGLPLPSPGWAHRAPPSQAGDQRGACIRALLSQQRSPGPPGPSEGRVAGGGAPAHSASASGSPRPSLARPAQMTLAPGPVHSSHLPHPEAWTLLVPPAEGGRLEGQLGSAGSVGLVTRKGRPWRPVGSPSHPPPCTVLPGACHHPPPPGMITPSQPPLQSLGACPCAS